MGREHKPIYKKPSLWLIIGLIALATPMTAFFFLDNSSYFAIKINTGTYTIDLANVTNMNVTHFFIVTASARDRLTVPEVISSDFNTDLLGDELIIQFATNPPLSSFKGLNFGVFRSTIPNAYMGGVFIGITYLNDQGNSKLQYFEANPFEDVDSNWTQAQLDSLLNDLSIPSGWTMILTIQNIQGVYNNTEHQFEAETTRIMLSIRLVWNPLARFDNDAFTYDDIIGV